MEQSNIERLFQLVDEITEKIQENLNHPYIDSLAIGLEYVFSRQTTEEFDDKLIDELDQAINEMNIDKYEKEEIRKAIQLVILKGMKGATQQQHLMTPDTVAMFIGYLANKFINRTDVIRLFDPACGTANLLTAVMNSMDNGVEAYGSEVDPTLIKLALMNANLQKLNVEFFHQDSLRSFLLEPVDVIISDLPVGYYPDDIQANHYQLKANSGHSYAHHLFIEQGLHYMKPAGYMILVIPNHLFTSEQSDKLNKFLQQHSHIVGMLQLPLSMFKSEQNAKSILILQKKGQATKTPKQTLMAQLPSFKNPQAMNSILAQMNEWFQNEGFSIVRK
ncbi:class I SAM-dependent methyltransferase [Aquibacillus sp. 3ASR75-54]|uniref:Class I SAM-dependent methyltransferase n=2 Tax=Aquibacillus salsiterrae TaxID=2950439 RepID=A0A9X3WE53_9BACI|nr:class I SAM-dependent methyltransferase [Aquibacillus salsiterrae]MDC3415769.1 class I SAM-dependent methyltransferase [Aquibacillus salsiterrae]